MKDILPQEAETWRRVEQAAREVFKLYNYGEIRIPIFEKTEVFARSIGETSDIVEKEMYTFTDRGGESLTLRPEGTASVVRAFVENGMFNLPGIKKLYYLGPMFRAERPQAGRFRQFHQIGAEAFGSQDPALDAEVIALLLDLFRRLNVEGLEVKLNSLGCPQCRPAFRDDLQSFLAGKTEQLCENCQRRVDKNPLRVFDCKSKSCAEAIEEAPLLDSYLCAECRTSIESVTGLLAGLGEQVTIDPRLVRGLDYYSRTAFEIVSNQLGAQSAVAGGGRYDSLVEQFGGPPTPALGFALGVERLISLIDEKQTSETPEVFLAAIGDEAQKKIFELAGELRTRGISADRAFGQASLKSQMKKADKSGARFAVIIGENEIAKDKALIKDMGLGSQSEYSIGNIVSILAEKVSQPPID